MKRNILQAAKVIRSKNSGPFELTLDIMFKNRRYYELFKKRGIISAARIARLYHVPQKDILKVIHFEPSHAIKVTLRRRIPSGGPGETDIYGAQQHAPLLDITF
ncbi:MAG: DUF4387 domain-containing protein [Acidobacteria bacterium]|nr:DUF4387 domain-containing protein [Acidobacteriota bacterium]MBE3131693.1 DUF4387 domain-containing protein [Acidobacteriota bacterium]MCX6569812.1 DUF4387 domain-containing protein [Candidatus Aminicenantes bacterium]